MRQDIQIEMARGDLYTFAFGVYLDGQLLDADVDEIYFTVKRRYTESKVTFQKRLSTGGIGSDSHGAYTISIEPEDTEELPFGEYDFDIEIDNADPRIVETFTGILSLTKEVTHKNNKEA